MTGALAVRRQRRLLAEDLEDEAVKGAPPPPRTKWTRRVPHPVLIGHAASLRRGGARRRFGCGGGGAAGGGGRRGRALRRALQALSAAGHGGAGPGDEIHGVSD